jgi:hypothetical protein
LTLWCCGVVWCGVVTSEARFFLFFHSLVGRQCVCE